MSQPEQSAAPVVLLVDDSPADVYIVRQSLKKHLAEFELHVVSDGEKALRLIEEADQGTPELSPSLFLLDLNLPKRSGQEVLRRIKASPAYGHIPVVILTSSDSLADRAETARLGATAYFHKPPDLEEFMRIGNVVQRILSEPKP